ncbi:MAG: nucleoside kinase [Methanolobus sp.]|jgi:ribokinase|uniref:Sugar kinase, ribokinase n=1 Tax=Methanolobus tindarius DSM 2278 TaxID=1090322 RepID=W9DP77_METTI|nr:MULTISPECIES: carbohydrate kinase family protein [Methanolobus]ETA66963.1 sugar kinase, ribokinase [Methanolobus tindarius DSM 2278]MDK2832383.1 nucleoside kinase [Methanolobus sp.]
MDRVITVVGHAAIDLLFDVENIAVHNESHPIIDYNQYYGGGAANIAVAIAILGGNAQLISAVGGDFASSGYEAEFEKFGVDLSLLYRFPEHKSTRAFVFTDREHNQSTYFHWGASIELKELEPPEVDFVHLATSDSTYNARIAKKAKFVSFDPGQDLVTYSRENLESILENTNILFTNKHEIQRVCEMTGKSMDDILSMIETVIVTYDASGSKIYNNGTEVTIPVVTVKALDPTGAGDAYRAGFLLAYTRGYPLEVCGKIGSTVASFAVQSIGCQTDLPTWDVMKARYEENFGKLELPA